MMARTTYLRATTLLVAMAAAAVVAVLAGYGSASAQDECQGDCEATTGVKGPDAALDRALKDLVAMPGGPPGVIAIVQRGKQREVHTSAVANLKNERPMEAGDRMRIASTAKAFSGAVALSLVSKGRLSLDDTIGKRLPDLPNA